MYVPRYIPKSEPIVIDNKAKVEPLAYIKEAQEKEKIWAEDLKNKIREASKKLKRVGVRVRPTALKAEKKGLMRKKRRTNPAFSMNVILFLTIDNLWKHKCMLIKRKMHAEVMWNVKQTFT